MFKPKNPKVAIDSIPMRNREIDNKIRGLKSMMLNRGSSLAMKKKSSTTKVKQIKKIPLIKKIRKVKKFTGARK